MPVGSENSVVHQEIIQLKIFFPLSDIIGNEMKRRASPCGATKKPSNIWKEGDLRLSILKNMSHFVVFPNNRELD